jgi:hypothetical protein
MELNEDISIDVEDILNRVNATYLDEKIKSVDISGKLKTAFENNLLEFNLDERKTIYSILHSFDESGNFVSNKSVLSTKRKAEPVAEAKKYNKNGYLIDNNLQHIFNLYPSHQFYSALFTLKNCDVTETGETIKLINQSLAKLWKRKEFKDFINSKKYESGYLKCIEVPKSENDVDEYNVHCHIILHLPNSYSNGRNYISVKNLTELWKSVIKVDYDPYVNIKQLKTHKDIVKSLKYDVKLFTQFYDNFNLDDEKELLSILKLFIHTKYKRFMHTNGTLKKLFQEANNKNATYNFKVVGSFNRDEKIYTGL